MSARRLFYLSTSFSCSSGQPLVAGGIHTTLSNTIQTDSCVERCRDFGDDCRGTLHIPGGDAKAGFGALFFAYVLQQLHFAEINCLSPCIKFLPRQAAKYFDGGNPWEYYFQPVCRSITSKRSCRLSDKSRFEMNRRAMRVHSYQFRIGYIHPMMKRYFKLKPEIEEAAKAEWKGLMGTSTHVLGLHMRGTDRDVGLGFRNHVSRTEAGPALYLPHVETFLKEFPDGLIFVATDDRDFASALKEWPVVAANAVRIRKIKRAGAGQRLFGNSNRRHEGMDALLDIVLLTWCNMFVHSTSEMAWAVRWWVGPRLGSEIAFSAENLREPWSYELAAPSQPPNVSKKCPEFDDTWVWETTWHPVIANFSQKR